MNSSAVTPISENGVLLHVGPHKTGTTAIQGSLAAARKSLAEQNVLYPGTRRSHAREARAITGVRSTIGAPAGRAAEWNELVAEVNDHRGRTVLSSEYFDVAKPKTARKIAAALGPDTHVLITATSLASLLPSNWQQSVRGSKEWTFDEWLKIVFEQPDHFTARRFWLRQRIDHMAKMWAEIVGWENVTVLVIDKHQPDLLYRGFESLLGLEDGTLAPPRSSTNRSFSAPEAELFRRINQRVSAEGWPGTVHARYVRIGAAKDVTVKRSIPPTEDRITLPRWAAQPAADVADEIVRNLSASGVRVIGSLDNIKVSSHPDNSVVTDTIATVDIDLAAMAVIGAMRGGGAALLNEPWVDERSLKMYPGVTSAPKEVLIDELKSRARKKLRNIGKQLRKKLRASFSR